MSDPVQAFRYFAVASVLLAVIVTSRSLAQESFAFTTPLRTNYVMSYMYTERVQTIVQDSRGGGSDTSERILRYYVKERQVPMEGSADLLLIETNIDSMNVDFRQGDTRVYFNTQNPATTIPEILQHREVLIPSALVSRPVTFKLTPYGQVVEAKSRMFDNLREQVEEPHLDNYTRDQALAMSDGDYLTTILFPWRNVVPLGRTVNFGKPISVPFYTALERITMHDTATVTLTRPKGDDKMHLLFTSNLDNPVPTKMMVSNISEPMDIASVQGSINGDLTMDGDGVVISGWSTASGAAVGIHGEVPISVKFKHEIYVELTGMEVFTTN